MDKQEQEQFNELVRIVAGYEGCGDCDDCSFSGICGDREVAQKLWDEGWRKEKKDG